MHAVPQSRSTTVVGTGVGTFLATRPSRARPPAYLWHCGVRPVLHGHEEGDVNCKLAQQAREDVGGEDARVGARLGQLRQRLRAGSVQQGGGSRAGGGGWQAKPQISRVRFVSRGATWPAQAAGLAAASPTAVQALGDI